MWPPRYRRVVSRWWNWRSAKKSNSIQASSFMLNPWPGWKQGGTDPVQVRGGVFGRNPWISPGSSIFRSTLL